MKNYWLKRNETKNFEKVLIDKLWGSTKMDSQLTVKEYKSDVEWFFLHKANHEIFRKIPKELDKVPVLNTFKCPVTYIKHNFTSNLELNGE